MKVNQVILREDAFLIQNNKSCESELTQFIVIFIVIFSVRLRSSLDFPYMKKACYYDNISCFGICLQCILKMALL